MDGKASRPFTVLASTLWPWPRPRSGGSEDNGRAVPATASGLNHRVLYHGHTPSVRDPGTEVGPVIATREEREGSAYSPQLRGPAPSRLVGTVVLSAGPTQLPPHVAIWR